MGLLSRIFSHARSGSTTGNYYSSMNEALLKFNDEYTMLHYPYFESTSDSFLEAQANLTDYCMSLLPSVDGKKLLEVGCGNGVQSLYLHEKYSPGHINAIDLNDCNIDIARKEAEKKGIKGIIFQVDDAHHLTTIESNTMDFVINIESAFHYPDKTQFLRQMHRVLKPEGAFVIADILTRNIRNKRLKSRWKRKMSYHHWPLSKYEAELPRAGFQNVNSTDITLKVIRGFACYKRWLREMKKGHFIEDLMLKLYYTIHTRLNMYLLKNRQQYVVFVGAKTLW
jgi:ubiquinone/menaquinone biosynthesis C-methylase UbiE